MKILFSEEMRRIEQKSAEAGVPPPVLMGNAGRAVAAEVSHFIGGVTRRHILVLVGPGNNGGDGLVAARYLHEAGAEVSLYLLRPRPSDDSNFALTQQRRLDTYQAEADRDLAELDALVPSATVIVDAVFGTGMSRAVSGIYRQVFHKVNQKRRNGRPLLVAVDVPSGLDADTGAADEVCPYADLTVTLGYPKHGLFRFPGAERVGKLVVVDIGIPPGLADDINTELITDEWIGSVLPARRLDANKGTFGRALVVAGSVNYVGAASLACVGAARAGAGLVTLAAASGLHPILAAKLNEVTHLPLPQAEHGIIGGVEASRALAGVVRDRDAVLLGCGLGQHPAAVEFVRSMIAGPLRDGPSLVLDADGLNNISNMPRWWETVPRDFILTPHPGEMARLAGITIEEVQRDRVGIVRKYAAEWHKTLVLKGAFTAVGAPDGRVKLSGVANPGLASAGTGDVLAGAIAGLLAQAMPLFEAAACGVALHARAGEMVRGELGDTGMIASDLLPALPKAIKMLRGR